MSLTYITHRKQKRPAQFNPNHNLSFGLSAWSRILCRKISSVTCRSCPTFGREEAICAKKTSHYSLYNAHFTSQFRTWNIKKHLIDFHAVKWGEYQQLDDDCKLTFFDKNLPYYETVPPHFGFRNIRIYQLFRPIIDTIINKILVSSDNLTRT